MRVRSAYQVTFYKTAAGVKTLGAWLKGLETSNPVLHDMVAAGLVKLRNPQTHKPHFTVLVDKERRIYEMRVGRKDIARVFFFHAPGDVLIATNAYVKQQQELDRGELDRAQRFQAD